MDYPRLLCYWIANCEAGTHWSACSKYFASKTVLLSHRMTSQASQQCCNYFFTLRPQCIWHGVKESDPIFWAHVRSFACLTSPREMFIAQQLMLLVLRNAFEILVLTAVNHSETDWNIRHAFRIWAYTDYFGSPTTPLMSVFGVRSECAETPKKNKK